MPEGRFPCEGIGGVPVVTAPEEIDITNAPELRSALVGAVVRGRGILVVDMTRTLRRIDAPKPRAASCGWSCLPASFASSCSPVLTR